MCTAPTQPEVLRSQVLPTGELPMHTLSREQTTSIGSSIPFTNPGEPQEAPKSLYERTPAPQRSYRTLKDIENQEYLIQQFSMGNCSTGFHLHAPVWEVIIGPVNCHDGLP
ncbi:hypothetical protein CVT25_011500 [Psilocybe cyanescens]|uniref:Uncharacterized protein n=1 Tax=Psilocybe cyanescens TaxID=93625 RepID=A0A409XA75_PSICY|nr:hypothetical protein CVT25_011500 [Psilocybe cyanescens]